MKGRMISRRTFLEGMALSTGVVLLASCAPAASPAGSSAAPSAGENVTPGASATTIAWWDYMGDANGAALDTQMAKYMETHPEVKIERTYIPFADLKQKLLQGAAAGQLPDVVLIDNPDHSSFAALGIFTDLTERVKEWGQESNYFPGPWASTLFQERNYGIPDNSNCLVNWYNKAFAEATGVQPPTDWEELKEAAAALTQGERYGFAVSAVKSEEGTFQWLPFLWMTGEDLATLDSDGGRAALGLWVDLVNNGYMSRGILNWTQGDVKGQFVNGLAAMMVNGPWQIPVIKEEAPDLAWDVATLPAQKQGASILGGENTAIVKSSAHIDAAWQLLTWRQEPENLKAYLLQAGKLPSNAAMAQDAAWTGDPVLNVFVEQLKVAKPRNYGPKYPEISNAIQEMLQAAISGQKPVDAAVAEAQAKITPLLPA
ncbi:MAG: sugar ABC transporter substrate-binding protein [Caldilinea sp.]|nr:sugar ABC transporter substrate-binding protein [Caldilinea sp.]MDW8441111.1 sugar ABC transporter substrate-binding protein [Caldilineaceae bacterium]